jgi:phosphoglycerate dehydrogenase-like enzyme
VLLTPHIGGSTVDAWRETEIETIRMVLGALAGRTVERRAEAAS